MPGLSEFGNASWFVIHYKASRYPIEPTLEQKTEAKEWMKYEATTFPCETCKSDFVVYLKDNPFEPTSRDVFEEYVYVFHNHVNIKRGVPSVYSLEEVRSYFRGISSKPLEGYFQERAQPPHQQLPTVDPKSTHVDTIERGKYPRKTKTCIIVSVILIILATLLGVLVGTAIGTRAMYNRW